MPGAVFIALCLLDLLLLWLLVKLPVRSHWGSKSLAIVLVLAFNFLLWHEQGSGRGWAVPATIPDGSMYVTCVVQEPKVIYIEAIPPQKDGWGFGYKTGGPEPRLYRVPYSRQMHESCMQAAKEAAQGANVGLRRPRGGGQLMQGPHGVYEPYDLPDPQLPAKGNS